MTTEWIFFFTEDMSELNLNVTLKRVLQMKIGHRIYRKTMNALTG